MFNKIVFCVFFFKYSLNLGLSCVASFFFNLGRRKRHHVFYAQSDCRLSDLWILCKSVKTHAD